MKTNVLLAIVALSYAPVAVGGNEAASYQTCRPSKGGALLAERTAYHQWISRPNRRA